MQTLLTLCFMFWLTKLFKSKRKKNSVLIFRHAFHLKRLARKINCLENEISEHTTEGEDVSFEIIYLKKKA
jgi:hypothetical protein